MRLWIAALSFVILACGAVADSPARTRPNAQAARQVIEAYYAGLNLKRCSRIDHYYVTFHREAGALEGRIWPGLEPELARFERLRNAAIARGLGAAIRDADVRWHDEDSRIDYVCGDSPVTARIQSFRRMNDDFAAALRRFQRIGA